MTSGFELNALTALILVGAGFMTGLINTLAGGGSLLSLPILMLVGMPSTVANATNRVGIALQNAAASGQFYRRGILNVKEGVLTALPALAGAAVGAVIAAEIDERVLDIVLGAVLLLMVATLFLNPRSFLEERTRRVSPAIEIPIFFLIGLYGGFIQAGVGFLIIAALTHLMGHELVRTSAQKVLIILLQSALSMGIFAFYGLVEWGAGLVLGVGTIAGAVVGVRLALSGGAKIIRWFVVLAVALSAFNLFGLI